MQKDLNITEREDKVKEILSDKLGIEPEKIKPESRVIEDLGE